jgi:hypothetical protein
MNCLAGSLFILIRIAMIVIRCTTNWFAVGFETTWAPILGWIFFPWTTFFYLIIMNFNNHEMGVLGWIIIVVGLFLDLGVFSGSLNLKLESRNG